MIWHLFSCDHFSIKIYVTTCALMHRFGNGSNNIMEMVEWTCTGQLANIKTKNKTQACIECWYCAKYRVSTSMIIH